MKNLKWHNVPFVIKILSAFTCVATLAVIIGIASINSIHKLNDEFELYSNEITPALINLLQIKDTARDIQTKTLTFNDFENIEEDETRVLADAKKYELLAKMEQLDRYLEKYILHTQKQSQEIIESSYAENIFSAKKEIVNHSVDMLLLIETNAGEEALREKRGLLDESLAKLTNNIDLALNRELTLFRKDKALISQSVSSSIQNITYMTIGSFILALTLAVVFSIINTKNLISLKNTAVQIAKGDFSKRAIVEGRDEVGQVASSFNLMADHLVSLLNEEKEMESQIQKEKHTIEEKVVERTEELAAEHARLESSINALTIGYISTNIDNRIVIINQTAQDILKINNEAIQKGILDVLYINDLFQNRVNLLAEVEKCKREKTHKVIKDASFNLMYLNIMISPILSKLTGDVLGVVILIENTTEEKVLQRSRDEFFSIASHELRTPLTAIKGNTSLIKDYFWNEITNEKVRQMLQDIHDSSDRLLDIVKDFLDMSRLEQGKLKYKNGAFQLEALCDSVIKEFEVTGSRQKLSLRFDHPTELLPKVYADPDRIRQIIINLVGNALKFTEEGGITVRCEVIPNFVKVSVTDTGKGISEENQKLLFRKFQQAQDDILTRDTTRGTGLGLYISKIMINGMGGDIKLEESIEGKGSTFSFTIPIAPSA